MHASKRKPNKAGVKRELLDTVKARKLAYYGHTMRKQESCLEKEIMQEAVPGARRRGRPRTAWMDNIKTWTGLFVGESIRMTEDRDKWNKKLSYRRGTGRCVVSIEILPITTQQCRNYLYDKS